MVYRRDFKGYNLMAKRVAIEDDAVLRSDDLMESFSFALIEVDKLKIKWRKFCVSVSVNLLHVKLSGSTYQLLYLFYFTSFFYAHSINKLSIKFEQYY